MAEPITWIISKAFRDAQSQLLRPLLFQDLVAIHVRQKLEHYDRQFEKRMKAQQRGFG